MYDDIGKYITDKNIDDFILHDLSIIKDGKNGSLFLFTGIVRRDKNEKGIVKEIIYEAYEEMAEVEINKIKQRAFKSFHVNKIVIKHRIGKIRVGEVSLFIAVLSPHRKEGIQAMDYIIDQIKTRVPIWKKEILEDGSHRWIDSNV